MSVDEAQEVPLFTECVIGYRAWRLDEQDQLWPISDDRRPWTPGVNTARCNCTTADGLNFEWTMHDGRRRLEPAPGHPAPADGCECGLYAWRRPKAGWKDDAAAIAPPRVVGAVACWGALQVHPTGVRAQCACVVTLAHHNDADEPTVRRLAGVADRYRVELVALDELEIAASRHGTPLPDDLLEPEQPADDEQPQGPEPPHPPAPATSRVPDATPEEVVLPELPAHLRSKHLWSGGYGYGT